MKIRDVVYVLEDRKITKTRIMGVQQTLETNRETSQKELVDRYLVRLEQSFAYSKADSEWITADDIYKTIDEAQQVIADRITAEIIDQQSKLVLVDLVDSRDDEPKKKVENAK